MKDDPRKDTDSNRDPITGEPGSHPVGTGVGAAAGGLGGAAAGAAAGAAMGTAGAGPIGTAIGAVAGAAVGAAAGHSTAEGLNPTSAPDEGRHIGYHVVDSGGNKVGTVESVWLDRDGDPAYLAIRTGWLGLGRIYVIPAQSADVSDRKREIRVPYSQDQIKNSPEFDAAHQLQSADEDRITEYYGRHGFRREGWLQGRAEDRWEGAEATAMDHPTERNIQLREEEIHVGKRQVEAGGVRLRKVVRTEVVNEPVELRREEIVIERVPASEATRTRAGAGAVAEGEFTEEEIYVPLRREEAVVAKEARVREEVRIGKREEREQQTISETVRKEDVEIVEETGEQSRLSPSGERPKTQRYEPKERSRQ